MTTTTRSSFLLAGIVDQERDVGRRGRGLGDVRIAGDVHLDRHQLGGCGER